mgnify:CR=1 FL=1
MPAERTEEKDELPTEAGNPLLKRLEPDAAEARDFTVVKEPDEHRMDADAVAVVGTVTQRVGNDDTLPTRMDGGQPNDPTDCARRRQFRVVEVLALALKHGYSPSSSGSQDSTLLP